MTKQTEKKNESSMENNNDLHCPTLRRLNTRYLYNQNYGKSFFPHLSAVYDHVRKVALRFLNYHQHKPKTIKQCCKERLFPLTVPLQPGVKKQVLANCQGKLIKCWDNLGWTSIPSRGGVGGNTHSCLMLQKVG